MGLDRLTLNFPLPPLPPPLPPRPIPSGLIMRVETTALAPKADQHLQQAVRASTVVAYGPGVVTMGGAARKPLCRMFTFADPILRWLEDESDPAIDTRLEGLD